MLKDILAYVGMLFLTGVVVGVVVLMAFLYQDLGLVSLPNVNLPDIGQFAPVSPTISVSVQDGPREAVWENPLGELPDLSFEMATPGFMDTPFPTDTPVPTATPIPPLDPVVYQTQTLIHLREFAGALEAWLDLNQKLGEDSTLQQDPTWRADIEHSLERIETSAHLLAGVGPEPDAYHGIAALLDQAAGEADGLVWNYRQALSSGDPASFRASGEHFKRLKEYLRQAAEQMLAAGWTLGE